MDSYLDGERRAELEAAEREERMATYEMLQAKVKELAIELPGVTFGYIGNCDRRFDDRVWMIFLPHPDRVGDAYGADDVTIGSTDDMYATTAVDFEKLAIHARRKYHNGSVRRLGYRTGHCEHCGIPVRDRNNDDNWTHDRTPHWAHKPEPLGWSVEAR